MDYFFFPNTQSAYKPNQKTLPTHDQTRKTRGREGERPAHPRDHADENKKQDGWQSGGEGGDSHKLQDMGVPRLPRPYTSSWGQTSVIQINPSQGLFLENQAYQSLCQEIHCQWASIREQRRKRPALAERQGTNVISRPPGRDRVKLIKGGCAEDVEYERQLVVVITARKQRLS